MKKGLEDGLRNQVSFITHDFHSTEVLDNMRLVVSMLIGNIMTSVYHR